MSQDNLNSSTTDSRKTGFSVSASPFNAVKLELGLILVVFLASLVAVDSITENVLIQILMLAALGMCGFAWLLWRTRSISTQWNSHQQRDPETHSDKVIDDT